MNIAEAPTRRERPDHDRRDHHDGHDFLHAIGVGTLARSYGTDVRLGRHAHREAQLLFAARGVMQVTTPAGRWLVPPERAVWLPPRTEHAVDILADIEMRTLYFEPDWLSAASPDPRLARTFVVQVESLLRQAILGLFDGNDHPVRRGLLARLAVLELAEAEDATTFMPLPNDVRARRVADLVLADPASVVDLDGLAAAAGTTARTVTRLFTTETNLTFKQWRQRARIMSAVEALGRRGPSIKAVAASLGFSSSAAFGHAFRQVMGVTPSEFVSEIAASL